MQKNLLKFSLKKYYLAKMCPKSGLKLFFFPIIGLLTAVLPLIKGLEGEYLNTNHWRARKKRDQMLSLI